jgi:hypothetical protein
MVRFLRTLGDSEVRLGYLNLTDDAGKHYGKQFPANRTRFVVIDQNGRRASTQKLQGNQLWGSLSHWYHDTQAKAGDTVILAFDSDEKIDGSNVIHLGIFDTDGGRRQGIHPNGIHRSSDIPQSPLFEPFLTPQAADIAEPSFPLRHSIKTYRILRDTALSRWLKQLYTFQCQICGTTIEISKDERYAEAHHIRPLGEPHNGPDILSNMLVLCPNHHAMCDLGAMHLTLQDLTISNHHSVSEQMINYHNASIAIKPAGRLA